MKFTRPSFIIQLLYFIRLLNLAVPPVGKLADKTATKSFSLGKRLQLARVLRAESSCLQPRESGCGTMKHAEAPSALFLFAVLTCCSGGASILKLTKCIADSRNFEHILKTSDHNAKVASQMNSFWNYAIATNFYKSIQEFQITVGENNAPSKRKPKRVLQDGNDWKSRSFRWIFRDGFGVHQLSGAPKLKQAGQFVLHARKHFSYRPRFDGAFDNVSIIWLYIFYYKFANFNCC